MKTSLKAVVFDAYGTLFDVYSIAMQAERLRPGKGAAMAALLREKQIDYTRLRTMCNRYVDFWQCTADALSFVDQQLQLGLLPEERSSLMQAYATLPPFADAAPVLGRLKTMGLPLAILSNGTPQMLKEVVQAAGLSEFFDALLSVDTVRQFKTADAAYALGPQWAGVAAENMVFVSSNGWDAACATWYGYRTFWVNRARAATEVLVDPHGIGHGLSDLIPWIEAK
jgi:2-haloacid dehalogenase